MRPCVDTGPSERGSMHQGARLEACKHQRASSRERCPRHDPSCRLAIEDGSAAISSSRLRSHIPPPGQSHPYRTFGGPSEPFSRVNRASEVRVIRMSLALPAFGQKAAMESKLAGFGRSFRSDTNAMIGKKLTCEGGRPRRRFNFRWFLTYPVSDRPINRSEHWLGCCGSR